ncbi:hypothetical protein SKAU_G00094090 [Synaphobranchus kaupii]|uniref:CCHC-type domain-containing protein n=1 Tax=Synaphobranchus kaupii TaxID=118154 RepID=A0A9Q1FY67_SYNKA|nr:hypothetical protein SKAU_G00094090 [Synaphobranchus kaupii]
MAVHLKFCLVGAARAIVHRNPRSSQWDYSRLVEEMETAYGPSSEHAAAVAIKLRQRVRKLGDAEIVQKLLEQRPHTLAQAYDIARRYETTKRAASYVTSLMHSGAHNMAERRPRAAVIREGAKEEQAETAAAFPAARWKPKPSGPSPHLQHAVPNPNYTPHKRGGCKDIKWEEIRCHNCSGLGHIKRNCPSPKKVFRTQASTASPETLDPAVLHLKAQDQEMSIHMLVHDLEVCAVLDSGARKSVLPLRHYNAIHPDIRPPLQPSTVETLLGVGPGDVPVKLVSLSRLTTASAVWEVPYFHPQSKPKAHAVRVARTVVLEAGQEYLVRGHTRCRELVKGEVMLSPTKGFFERHKLLVARVLVEAQPSKTVPLRIFNPGSAAVTIKKGAAAGLLHPAKALQPADTADQLGQAVASSPAVPQHLQELYAQSSTELKTEEQLQLAQLLCTYGSVFSAGPNDLSRTSLVQHDNPAGPPSQAATTPDGIGQTTEC